MAAAGKKLRGNGARRKSRSPSVSIAYRGLGRPPHPARVHAGQRYWSRVGATRRPIVIQSVGRDGAVLARRVDGALERVRVTRGRLLDVGPDGQGRYFKFLGWSSRRYRTWAVVIEIHGGVGSLILPEWHPAARVALLLRLLPDIAREAGAWLKVSADLSACCAAHLNLAHMAVIAPTLVPPELVMRVQGTGRTTSL
jgi:hypothetical protein